MIHCPLNTGPITTAPVSLSLVLLFIPLPYDLSRHLVYSVQSSLWGKCVSEKIAFIYISFQLLLYTRILNSHLHTDEPLASNVVFAGTPPVSL